MPERPARELWLNVFEGEDRFAKGEREPRADLEDREVVLDQPAQRFGALVVGRVGLVDQPALRLDEAERPAARLAVVRVHRRVAELHAGLHDHGDDALPGVAETGGDEGLAGESRVRATSAGGVTLGPASPARSPPGVGTSVPTT